MGLLEFNKLPINTLVGADWKTFKAVTAGQEIDKGFRGKFRLTKSVCRLLSTLKPLEDSRYEKLCSKPLWAIGEAVRLLSIMFSRAISILAIRRPIRPFSRT